MIDSSTTIMINITTTTASSANASVTATSNSTDTTSTSTSTTSITATVSTSISTTSSNISNNNASTTSTGTSSIGTSTTSTSTSSTSTSTTSTGTSSTSTSTTSTGTSSTSTSTTSTRTSSTSTSTTSTGTSTTVTTSSSTTTTATISNACTGGTTYTTQLLYLSLNLNSILPWTKYSFNYTAPNINSAMIVFSFRNDPAFWYLDSVSVTNSLGQQMWNGGFEQGTLADWTYCNPSNSNYSGQVDGQNWQSGSYCYADGSVGAPDYLSQTFTVVPNYVHSVKFWLSADTNSSGFALVSITG